MKRLFTAFVEHKEFSQSQPWSVIRQVYPAPTIAPPHYAETVEIMVYNQVHGIAYINGQEYKIDGQKVLYIPPQTVHSFDYPICDGYALVLKLHPEMLKEFINLDNILNACHHTLSTLSICHENFETFHQCAMTLFDSNDLTECLGALITIFSLLIADSDNTATDNHAITPPPYESLIHGILTWTEQNFSRKFSLEEVASAFGYSKNYFCDIFKKHTGITYLSYLNHVRISAACRILSTGTSVKETAHICGFETESYFIQLFKKITGITPKTYQLRMFQ